MKEEICRICLCQSASQNIFTSNVYCDDEDETTGETSCQRVMVELFSLTVSPDDGLPSSVCDECFAKLSSASNLKRLAERSYLLLLDGLLKKEHDTEIVKVEIFQEDDASADFYDDDNETGDDPIDCGAEEKEKLSFFENKKKLGVWRRNKTSDDERDLDYVPPPLSKRMRRKLNRSEEGRNETIRMRNGNKTIDTEKETCDLCGTKFENKKKLRTHMRTHSHDKKEYPCERCPKVYLSIRGRSRHVRIDHLSEPYFCGICKRYFKCKTKHIRNCHSDAPRKHECASCDKKFMLASQLASHTQSTHTKERPFLCQVCGKAFGNVSLMKQHQLSFHDKVKRLECDHCSKKFCTKSQMIEHMFVHSTETKFECDLCGKRFRHRKSWKLHAKKHTGIRDYKCKICEKAFCTSSGLYSHMFCHDSQRNHICTYCNATFNLRSRLTRHIKGVHKDLFQGIDSTNGNCKFEQNV